MRISDWSSDVCSSDLQNPAEESHVFSNVRAEIVGMPPEVENRSRNRRLPHRPADTAQPHLFKRFQTGLVRAQETAGTHVHQRIAAARFNGVAPGKIGRASGRERGGRYG